MAVESRRVIVNEDGYLVDLETGEVVDESPLCLDARCELPASRDRDEFERRLRAAVLGVQPPGERSRVVSFKLPQWLVDLVDREAERRRLGSRSVLIRDALVFYLMKQDSVLAMVKRLRDLYAARGFLYAARSLLGFAAAYAPDAVLKDDVRRVEEELEAALKHFDDAIAEAHRRLGLW